ncbi:MAG: C4-dicarboxylate transporter DctA [Proteobacteria bacterium]|nr:C4-dicarboxylate transporter DctA [Pseudomonadota bacterium]
MRYLKLVYVQVLIGVALGVLVGVVRPDWGVALKPLGDAFIALIKLVIAPVVFCTVATGIARMGGLKTFGRVGGKTLLYFEVVSTFALGLGLLVAEVLQPGAGFNADPKTLDAKAVASFVDQARHDSVIAHLQAIIPDTFIGAFAKGDLLQVLLIAILIGFACTRLGGLGEEVANGLEKLGKLFFAIIHIVVRAAPIGAFGAMAFTVGKFGAGSLVKLGALIGTFYLTSVLFVVVVLGLIAWSARFSIFRFIAYIREELLIVLGTSSSETVLPQIMEKLTRLGASRPIVGLVIPTGYSFNLDGTNIYMTLATLFLAQATNTHLTIAQELEILAVAMLTSKGASGVTGAGFITLAATLAVVPSIPLVSIALLVGIDRFMSECRALTNLVGNGVATLVIARWEGELDEAVLHRELRRGPGGAEAHERLETPA